MKSESKILILDSIEQLRSWRLSLPSKTTVGFVPTMGALHSGHGELLKQIRTRCDISVLSIFVNPTQFGPSEDLAKYPRTFERDLELAKSENVDVVFAPQAASIYPSQFSTFVEETLLSKPFCGAFRPGHFRGVTTVVLKLFNIVAPHVALFGLKDIQQFLILSRMVRDLNLDISVEGIATVRESDGLAMSSRNTYLSPHDRERAPVLYKALLLAAEEGRTDIALSLLERSGFRMQYFEFRELPDLTLTHSPSGKVPCILAAAGYLGTTRLIDNIILYPELLEAHGIRVASSPKTLR